MDSGFSSLLGKFSVIFYMKVFDWYNYNQNINNKRAVVVQGSAVGKNLAGPYYTGPKWHYFL